MRKRIKTDNFWGTDHVYKSLTPEQIANYFRWLIFDPVWPGRKVNALGLHASAESGEPCICSPTPLYE